MENKTIATLLSRMSYVLIFFIVSCQNQGDPSKNYKSIDTAQTNSSKFEDPISNQPGKIVSAQKNPSDTIFLGFRLGMSHSEFNKHKQELLQRKKLKNSNNDLIYQIEDESTDPLSILQDKEDDTPKTKWTAKGVVTPEFFDDKLISITIKFLKSAGSNVYWFLVPKLDEKYYKSTPQTHNVFDIDKKLDTMEVGKSISSHIQNNWTAGDVNISVRFDHKNYKLAKNKLKQIDDVVLKYWSEYYYSQKADIKKNEGLKRNKESQNDL
jgi:hypothetical protein